MKKVPVFKFKKVLSVFLALVMILGMLPSILFGVNAAGSNITRVSDPATVNNWKAFFGPTAKDTTYVGGVWTDKSVFTSVKDYTDATDESDDNIKLSIGENNFLVALSAIASTKSIEGYSTLPTDTILVLDLSASMNTDAQVDPYVTMVSAANNAIDKLLTLNSQNRVGVIAYSGNTSTNSNAQTSSATVILPLGRYTKGLDGNNNRVYLVSSWRNNGIRNGVKVASGVTGTVADGVKSTFSTNNSKTVTGGTYTQNGIYKAYQMFDEVTETVIPDGVQAGTKRKPVMVLMSDGCPTVADTDYTQIGTSNSGNGSEDSYGSNGIAFMTQLTASWARDKIEEKYDNEALVYTLGLNVGNKAPALSLLDPSNNTSTDSYWTTFKALDNNETMNVQIRNTTNSNNYEYKTISYTAPVNESKGWSESYVTQYFGANNTAQLNKAFEDIVQQIIVQSLYYPTLVDGSVGVNHDGFIEFDDYIGKNMEVKAVKGIQLGSNLYDGSTLAKMILTGGMGTVENPTEAGNNLVWAVKERMGITDTLVARELIGQAYANGQLFYDAQTGEYSNYIGWYADKDGKYVAFWDGKDDSPSAVPAGIKDKAVFAVKSYGYYDAVGEGHRKTDMMYATIQVRTTLTDGADDASEVGDIRVIGRLPASLIPLVEYDIKLNGTDIHNPSSMTIKGATAPSRLIYEVGLHSDIDILNIEKTAKDPLVKNKDGDYVFYTNQWQSIDAEDYQYKYSENKNTISFFEPSKENERYYYNVDSTIYTDKNGTLYKGEEAPEYDKNKTLYHRSLVYREVNGALRAEWFYEEISQYVLSHKEDLAKKDDNSWYVVAGTVYHYYGDYIREKDENKTGTINVSDMPFVHDLVVGVNHDEYHVDSFLGNNGLLTLDAYEGVVVSKFADTTIANRNQSYEFTITATGVTATLDLVIEDANGNRVWSTIDFNDSYTVSLKHNEKAYILGDALIGKTVKVTENTEGKDYEVYSVNGDINADSASITVSDAVISPAAFINTIPQDGDVTITKFVESTIEGHLDDEFTFEVTLTGTGEFDGVYTNGTTVKIIAGQTNTVKLTHGSSLVIKDIPKGTTVKVKEINLPSGFTADELEKSATVVAGQTQSIVFSNTYDAESTDKANIGITVKKVLTDELGNPADWTGTFKFALQKWNGTTYDNVGSAFEINYTKNGANTAEVNLLKDEVYSEVGTHYYRIVEIEDASNVAKGIVYDTVYSRFSVSVIDDGSGKLKVDAINNIADTSISGTNVTATFNNSYRVNGAAEAIIEVNKVVENIYGQTATISPAGFSFSLYEADADYKIINNTAVATSPKTAAAGTTRLSVLYTDKVTKDYYYVLKEDSGNIDNVTYTDKEYNVKVSVRVENSYYSITVTVYDGKNQIATASGVANANNVVAVAQVTGIGFKNTYTPESVILVPDLAGEKVLFGRDIKANEFSFVLIDKDGKETVVKNDANGYVAFGKLEYLKEGVYTYTIKELIPDEAVNNKYNGVTYDTSVYTLKVTVTGSATTGKLTATSVLTKNGQSASAIVFNNTYTTEHTDASIEGTKTLLGGIRKLQAGAFSFSLIEDGKVIDTVKNDVPTGDYKAGFKFNLHYDTAGEHTYTVKEVIPADAVNNALNGITYDGTEYTVKVSVVDNGKGQLVATVDYNGKAVEFENTYAVAPVAAEIPVKKNLEGDSVSKHTFEFELYTATLKDGEYVKGNLIATAQSSADGTAKFDSSVAQLNFNTIGGYRFIVVEKAGTTALMDYDKTVYEVGIDVTDNLSGQLVTEANITKVTDNERIKTGAIVFNNKYNEAPIVAEIVGEKSYNKTLGDGQFTFELYQALPDSQGKINAIGEAVLYATNDALGNFKFAEENGTGYITYTREGIYYYVIKEAIPENAVDGKYEGIAYDDTLYYVTVTVEKSTDASGRSILTAKTEYSDTVVFTNSYTADKTTAQFEGKKTISGRKLKNEEFTFALYDEDGKEIDTAKNDADGVFKFDEIEYTKADVYTYTVKELVPDEAVNNKYKGVTYDLSVYTVTVTVTDNGKGQLIKAIEYKKGTADAEGIAFENTYKAENASFAIEGKKTLKGKDLKGEDFTFILLDSFGKELERVKNDKDGKFSFEATEYTKEGEYTYTVKELAENIRGITFDSSVYTVKITVEDNEEGYLEASAEYFVETQEKTSLTFTNEYKEEEVPQTGDNMNVKVLLVVSSVSMLAILVLIALKRRLCK